MFKQVLKKLLQKMISRKIAWENVNPKVEILFRLLIVLIKLTCNYYVRLKVKLCDWIIEIWTLNIEQYRNAIPTLENFPVWTDQAKCQVALMFVSGVSWENCGVTNPSKKVIRKVNIKNSCSTELDLGLGLICLGFLRGSTPSFWCTVHHKYSEIGMQLV